MRLGNSNGRRCWKGSGVIEEIKVHSLMRRRLPIEINFS
jgi:hypothetical protein